jgi:uncharacterized protein YbjQ (UPF0145 family)
MKLRLPSGLAALALGIALTAAPPANAQRAAAEIALVEAAAPAGAVVLGEVRAEIHQTSLFARTPARDLADKELRAQAARLGADAVVDIKYESNAPLFSKKGFRAAGKAVRFAPAPVQVAATAPPAPKPAPEPGRTATFESPATSAPPVAASTPLTVPATAPVAPVVLPPPVRIATPTPAPPAVAPAAVPAPQITAVTPAPVAPPQVVAAAAPAPVAPPIAQPAPVAAAAVSVAPRALTPEALIVLTEEDLAGRAYDRLGEVKAEARQTSLFPKKSARVLMDEQLRAQAAKLGADAVILVKYDSYSPVLSKKGASATGIAVKYR